MSTREKNFLTLPDTMRSSWSAEGSALVAESLRASGCSRLRVRGESMLPALWPGDVIEIASCSPEDARPGEIVLALRDGRLFLHRFLAPCEPSGFLLRGDSMPGPDPQFPSEALLGRLVQKVDEGRTVCPAVLRPGFRAKWLGVKWSRALGALLCHCGVARRLALKLHSRRQAPARDLRHPEPAADMSSAELAVR